MVNDGSRVNLQVGGETVMVSGKKLKSIAKQSLDNKAQDEDAATVQREAAKMSDMLYNVESITTNMTKNALFKERLLSKEKNIKTKKDLTKLDEMIEAELEKEKCIKTFLEREANRQRRKQMEHDTDEQLHEITNQVKAQVDTLKKVYSNKMQAMDRETERIKMEKMKKLTEVKLRISALLIDQEIKGSISNCKHGNPEEQEA